MNCSVARTLDVIGEWWTMLIVRDAFRGVTRFEDFHRGLGIARTVLSARLDRLVDLGIFTRRQYSDHPPRSEYLLTEKGRDLAPALIALTEWGDRWAAPDGPPILYRHSTCGSDVGHQVVCSTCGRVDDPAEVRALPGSGMPADRAERMAQRTGSTTP
jgi:DNA-binding HxlR family transcriptional regulator